MRLSFSKYEGLGNDFMIVDVAAGMPSIGPAQAARLCDRHLGVGGDGVLLIANSGSSRFSMKVINADGSIPEMCGNGIRCVALHLARTGRAQGMRFEIDTDSGPHACRVLSTDESGVVEVAMRPPSLNPSEVPVLADAPVVDAPLAAGSRILRVTAVSMGNPHAVTFDDVGEQRLTLAPAVQYHARFPHGVNVGFARALDAQRIDLAVYERGAGWTRACGTGACAAAVAAVETGRARRGTPIEVRLPGGPLTIVVGAPGERLIMTGAAKHVFDGVVEI
jgi:diaminopimelate epimerase